MNKKSYKVEVNISQTINIQRDNFANFCVEYNCGKKRKEIAIIEFKGLTQRSKITNSSKDTPLKLFIPLCKSHAKLFNVYSFKLEQQQETETDIEKELEEILNNTKHKKEMIEK